jgi:hypothetical protein
LLFSFLKQVALVVTRILMTILISFSLEIWLAAARELLEMRRSRTV